MALRLVQVNFKAQDHGRLGRFWADALGWGLSSEGPGVTNVEPVGFDWPDPSAVCVDVVGVPDPETVAYRVHLELGTATASGRDELVARLLSLGATPIDGPDFAPGVALADPEGNVFTVLEPAAALPGEAGTGPIATVVVDCGDPEALAGFWGAAAGWILHGSSPEAVRLRAPEGVGPFLEFRRGIDEEARPSRIHIDLLPAVGDDQGLEVDRLLGLGASHVDVGQGDVAWVCLADPEGNDFCVLRRG